MKQMPLFRDALFKPTTRQPYLHRTPKGVLSVLSIQGLHRRVRINWTVPLIQLIERCQFSDINPTLTFRDDQESPIPLTQATFDVIGINRRLDQIRLPLVQDWLKGRGWQCQTDREFLYFAWANRHLRGAGLKFRINHVPDQISTGTGLKPCACLALADWSLDVSQGLLNSFGSEDVFLVRIR